ncbi:unnamed protein product [Trichobilharzia regenti]|nr:unnamed protein product [Trichobilharzia regenti]
MLDLVRLKNDAEQYGQGHLFAFWDELDAKQKSELLENISRLNFANIDRMLRNASNPCSTSADIFSPPDPKSCGSLSELRTSQPCLLKQYADSGTRLGVSYPKGLYKPNLPSGRSLYQIQAERLCRVSHMCKEKLGITPSITWYIMTSEHTKEMTIQFFESFDYFGYNRDDIVFFEQFTLPAFSVDGKILLETKSRLAFSPGKMSLLIWVI